MKTPHHHTTTTTTSPETLITNLVLTSTPKTLPHSLKALQIPLTPILITNVLKNLWNHAPKALQFFSSLPRHVSSSHSPLAFDHAIDIAARLKDYKTVNTLLSRMQTLRLGPTRKTFAIVFERYASSGKPDKAVKLFLSMHNYNCVQGLESFNTLLDVLCKSRRVEKAYGLLRALRGRFRADTISYNIVANGFCLVKQTGKALEVLKEMVEKGLSPSLVSFNVILKGYFRDGRVNDGWEFFLEMRKRGCEIDVVTYTTVVHGLGVFGEVKRARKVFDEMIGKGVLPSVSTYNAFIQVLCKKDSVDNAILVFDEMVRKGYLPNSVTYNLVIRGLCHRGEMSRALEYVDRMKKDECCPNIQTYNLLIKYYCEDGEIDKGLDVFEKMGSEGCLPNLDTYNILISSMFVRKKSEDLLVAGKLLIEMVDRGFMPRRFTFNRVLNGLLLTGNQGFAKEILRLQSKCARLPRHFRL